MLKSQRRAGLSAAGFLVVMSAAAGLLLGAILIPVVGAIGVATKNAATTFNTLSVPSLGQLPSRSEILDSSGRLIAYYYPNDIDRVPVSYNQIAPVMRHAIVAIEDARFYDHGAFDIRGTVRALVNDLQNTAVQGGSTLAQQYVKNALILTASTPQERQAAQAETPERKIRELRMAAIVEHELTKNELLAAYLNAAFFENQAVGIEVAAERYFDTTAARLTLPESAMLAGMVEFPTFYNPVINPKNALNRRNEVLQKMAEQGYITNAAARAAEAGPLGLHMHTTSLQSGCTSVSAKSAAFFCDYVLAALRINPAYATAYRALRTTGGLKIYTTLNRQDQHAANYAVNYVEAPHSSTYNPGGEVDTEVLIKPGTGAVRAIAVDRPYGTGRGQTTVDYAVNRAYDGSNGVQTGSSSKLFTLLTALKEGVPFGFNLPIVSPSSLTGYYNCKGGPTGPFDVSNAEGAGKGTFTLYNGTTGSINVFYAELERKVGLCNVVKTAVSLGMTRGDGTSLLRPDRGTSQQYSADNYPSFTLGSVNVSPMNMAAAYATVAARGIYCRPVAVAKILTATGVHLPVESAGCHRVLSTAVADAANFILQGVLTAPGATADDRGIGRPAAAKTGTANQGFYAAFAGYTPTLAGYVSVFNPIDPTTGGEMLGYPHSCYRDSDGSFQCPGQMYGDMAPGATWQLTFLHASLGPPVPFVGVSPSSAFFSEGNGFTSPKPPKAPKPTKPGGGNGNGNGGGGNGKGGPPTPKPK